ncbi:MAG: hypothetical protein HOV80_07625 [Polyangiaceae bacterium]|nr:hypothetical protein [Polyangiaceae bacterium]
MWVDTEEDYDGFNLQASTDGGMNWDVIQTVVPAYPTTVGGQPAWGDQQASLGWQLVTANLAAYNGQVIKLRFAFQSDSSLNFAGGYVDDFLVQ